MFLSFYLIINTLSKKKETMRHQNDFSSLLIIHNIETEDNYLTHEQLSSVFLYRLYAILVTIIKVLWRPKLP